MNTHKAPIKILFLRRLKIKNAIQMIIEIAVRQNIKNVVILNVPSLEGLLLG
jgi:hypothetical protein